MTERVYTLTQLELDELIEHRLARERKAHVIARQQLVVDRDRLTVENDQLRARVLQLVDHRAYNTKPTPRK